MFTIRHIYGALRCESVFQTQLVTVLVTPEHKTVLLFDDVPPGAVNEISDGTVFVMNENGKTVARYNLDNQVSK